MPLGSLYKYRATQEGGTARRGGGKYEPPSKSKVEKMIQSAITGRNPMRHKDLSASWTTLVHGTPQYSQLTNVTQGDTDITREGDTIVPIKLKLRANLDGNATTTSRVRLMVVDWFPDSATETPTFSALLESATSTVATLSPLNFDDKKDKFRVLYDKVFILHGQNATGGDLSHRKINVNIKLNNKKMSKRITYDNSSTDGQHQIYLCGISDQTVSGPDVTWYSQFIFQN